MAHSEDTPNRESDKIVALDLESNRGLWEMNDVASAGYEVQWRMAIILQRRGLIR